MSEFFTLVDDQPQFLVIDKRAGVGFHREGEVAGLLEHVMALGYSALWPVHRLDKMTSGLLLIAKNAQMAAVFGEMFAQRQIQKCYVAIAEGKPKKKQGAIIGDMAPSRRRSWKLLTTRNNPAITQFFSTALGDGQRLFLLRPHSGKTHQLRVALKSLGAAVAGDDIYQAAKAASFDRGYLHAYALQFSLSGVLYSYCLKPDHGSLFQTEACQLALQQYAKPFQLPWPVLPCV